MQFNQTPQAHRLLRCHLNLARTLVRSKPQQCGDIAGTIQIFVILQREHFDVAFNGNRNNRIADVAEFAGRTSAGNA